MELQNATSGIKKANSIPFDDARSCGYEASEDEQLF